MKNPTLNILSLEDSVRDYEIICELLIDDGFDFTIKRVENQQDFVLLLNSQEFDVILSDFTLPGFNAFGALKCALEICPDTPFIVVSGSIGEETAIELIKNGAVDYVLKDKAERLPHSVRRALEEVEEKQARKLVEEKLKHEQYLMDMMMDNVPDHIYFKDKDGRFIRINRSNAVSFGLSDPDEAIGKTDFDFFSEIHARQAYEDEQIIMITGQPLIGIEEKQIRNDEIEAWFTTTKMPLLNKEGEIVGTFGISKDITERKQAEEALRKKVNDLEYFHKFTVGRELTMIELKKEINSLLKQAGKEQKYLLTD